MLRYERVIFLILLQFIVLVSCSKNKEYRMYTENTIELFDTVHIIKGYAKNEKEFKDIYNIYNYEMRRLDKLYSGYENFDGINNLKTINDNAGIKPIVVDKDLLDLLEISIKWNKEINSAVNIAFGPVISEWEKQVVPDSKKLKELSKCTNIDNIVIDKSAGTVFLKEKCMKLNVGAIAKGYAVELVARKMEKQGITSVVISAGGNIKVVGNRKVAKKDKEIRDLRSCKSNFCIGLMPPVYNNIELDSNNPYKKYKEIAKLSVKDMSVVTTGDYQRYFIENGRVYNHVIDVNTLNPSKNFTSVTIITKDSGIADFLSTTLFLLSEEEGKKIIEKLSRDKKIIVDVIWLYKNGKVVITDNLKNGENYVLYAGQ